MNITTLKSHIDKMLAALVSKLFDKSTSKKGDWFDMVENTISIVP